MDGARGRALCESMNHECTRMDTKGHEGAEGLFNHEKHEKHERDTEVGVSVEQNA